MLIVEYTIPLYLSHDVHVKLTHMSMVANIYIYRRNHSTRQQH
jgi:hypothetical protein